MPSQDKVSRGGSAPYEIAWSPRGVVVTYSGEPLADEVRSVIAADPKFDELRFAIVDTLRVRSIALPFADVELIEAFLHGPACTNPNVTIVFVANHPDVLAALSAYDAIPDRAFKQVVCGSVEDARASIDHRRPEFRPRGSYNC